jgi:hypothetical protein
LLQKCAQYYPNLPNLDLPALSRASSEGLDSTSSDSQADSSETSDNSLAETSTEYNVNNFDDLFEAEDAETDESTSNSSLSEQQKIEDMEKQALGRHFHTYAGDVRDYLEKIQVMFTVAYEELDNAAGKDLCYACIEEPFFRPLWPYILALSRCNKNLLHVCFIHFEFCF